MSGFKRFCMIVFALMGAAALGALLLPWTVPAATWATAMLAVDWYLYLVEGLCLVTFAGFVAVFVTGVRARGQHDVQVLDADGGKVTIARSAVASQATYLVEEDGLCVATKVVVDARHRDRVDVSVQVEPYRSLDVRAEAARLQKRLRDGLTVLVGDSLGDITLRFLEPRTTADITPGDDVRQEKDGSFSPTEVHRADREARHALGEAPEEAADYGVTVPLPQARAAASGTTAQADADGAPSPAPEGE